MNGRNKRASLEIRIGSYDGILTAGCIEGNISALEYMPVSLHKNKELPLFFVGYVGIA